jgi:hypothetical protein
MSGEKKNDRQANDEWQEEGRYGRLQDKNVLPLARFAGGLHHTLAIPGRLRRSMTGIR